MENPRGFPLRVEINGNSIYWLTNCKIFKRYRFALVWFTVLNATFNNISVILWQSVSLVEETGIPGENHQPVVN